MTAVSHPAPVAAAARPPPRHRHRLPLGAAQAARAEADLPRARRRLRRAGHLRDRRCWPTRAAAAPTGSRSGRFVRETGLAVPLVCLTFGAFWLIPLITALVAGDIVATEDQNGTLKTILTRSVERWHVFAGKTLAALTYAVAVLVLYVGSALLLGGLAFGFDPVTLLSGTRVSTGHGIALIGAGTLAYLMPVIAIASIALLLSTVTRNSAAAVVGALMTRCSCRCSARCRRWTSSTPTCSRRSSTPGRACCATRSTGTRSCARRGCRPLYARAVAARGADGLRQARRDGLGLGEEVGVDQVLIERGGEGVDLAPTAAPPRAAAPGAASTEARACSARSKRSASALETAISRDMPHSPQRRNIHHAASPAGSHETGCTKSRPQTGQISSPASGFLASGDRRLMVDAVSPSPGARPTGPPRVRRFGRPYRRVGVFLRGLLGADRLALEARLVGERRVVHADLRLGRRARAR